MHIVNKLMVVFVALVLVVCTGCSKRDADKITRDPSEGGVAVFPVPNPSSLPTPEGGLACVEFGYGCKNPDIGALCTDLTKGPSQALFCRCRDRHGLGWLLPLVTPCSSASVTRAPKCDGGSCTDMGMITGCVMGADCNVMGMECGVDPKDPSSPQLFCVIPDGTSTGTFQKRCREGSLCTPGETCKTTMVGVPEIWFVCTTSKKLVPLTKP